MGCLPSTRADRSDNRNIRESMANAGAGIEGMAMDRVWRSKAGQKRSGKSSANGPDRLGGHGSGLVSDGRNRVGVTQLAF